MDYKYNYQDPLYNGYSKIQVSKSLHNSVFKIRQRNLLAFFTTKFEYYANDWNVKLQMTPSLFAKVIGTLSIPIGLIFYGIASFPELKHELYCLWNPKKTGQAFSDHATGDNYRKIMDEVNKGGNE